MPLSSCDKKLLTQILTDEMVLRRAGLPDAKKALVDS
jgi:hypothetical protein